jgi:hypothetical protein
MWFLLGLLCGGAVCGGVFLCLPKEKRLPPPRAAHTPKGNRKQWGETRNFLYYDGTMMPEIKEDSDE